MLGVGIVGVVVGVWLGGVGVVGVVVGVWLGVVGVACIGGVTAPVGGVATPGCVVAGLTP